MDSSADRHRVTSLARRSKLRELDKARPVEREGYECRRLLAVNHSGGYGVPQCHGRMIATFSTITREPVVTCNVCGRVALAEPEAPDGPR